MDYIGLLVGNILRGYHVIVFPYSLLSHPSALAETSYSKGSTYWFLVWNPLQRDHIGIVFLYSLLRTSKSMRL